jgi:hypothetical protein
MCVRLINAAWTTPLSLGRKWEGETGKGERVIGGRMDYRNGMILSEITPDGVEISLSAHNLVLVRTLQSNKRCVLSLLPVNFPSVY